MLFGLVAVIPIVIVVGLAFFGSALSFGKAGLALLGVLSATQRNVGGISGLDGVCDKPEGSVGEPTRVTNIRGLRANDMMFARLAGRFERVETRRNGN